MARAKKPKCPNGRDRRFKKRVRCRKAPRKRSRSRRRR